LYELNTHNVMVLNFDVKKGQFSCVINNNERRSGKDRRSGIDRRNGNGFRTKLDRRSGSGQEE